MYFFTSVIPLIDDTAITRTNAIFISEVSTVFGSSDCGSGSGVGVGAGSSCGSGSAGISSSLS